ncbi:hypothetical protein [Pacificoceanicola onchidii]|uniref:hypothetical protein n=1 Tax=Pacificoceanicola onchidii TaxID=2562685 RepID=UPI0010A2FA22|nr:hypothetical protein [Pacificoceanicola onchidii]
MRNAPDLIHSLTCNNPIPCLAQDAWLSLKEAQRLEDGTSGAINPERMARLEAMPSHWPTVRQQQNEVLASLDAARPRITAAILRLQGASA